MAEEFEPKKGTDLIAVGLPVLIAFVEAVIEREENKLSKEALAARDGLVPVPAVVESLKQYTNFAESDLFGEIVKALIQFNPKRKSLGVQITNSAGKSFWL